MWIVGALNCDEHGKSRKLAFHLPSLLQETFLQSSIFRNNPSGKCTLGSFEVTVEIQEFLQRYCIGKELDE